MSSNNETSPLVARNVIPMPLRSDDAKTEWAVDVRETVEGWWKVTILRDGQNAVMEKYGKEAEMDLVFHGGSGSDLEDIRETLGYGVVKMNIDTDLRLASTGAIRKFLAENPSEFDPRKYFKASMLAMQELCVARYEAFGTAGNAHKMKALSLDAMFDRYQSGELDPKIK